MASVIIDDINLTNIANAIREKNGSSETYKPSEMSAAISSLSSGSGGDDFSLDLTNITKFNNWNYYGHWNEVIKKYGSKIIFPETAESLYQAFYEDRISTDLSNLTLPVASNIKSLFHYCTELTKLPNFKNTTSLIVPQQIGSAFYNCWMLREIPNDFFTSKYTQMETGDSAGALFASCYSLRELPDLSCFNDGGCNSQGLYTLYVTICADCYTLNEIINLPVITKTNLTSSNSFSSAFSECWRIKNMTFATQADGTPYTVNWKNQKIDLSYYVGYVNDLFRSSIYNYNAGIPYNKDIYGSNTYQTLKNDPDAWTTDIRYSRYNHDSAVATINSLPDTSAYLAANGGTNTIKFKGQSGELTDEGAISNLTEEEIAVATVKGWTVSLI